MNIATLPNAYHLAERKGCTIIIRPGFNPDDETEIVVTTAQGETDCETIARGYPGEAARVIADLIDALTGDE